MIPKSKVISQKKAMLANFGLVLFSLVISLLIADIIFYHFFPQPTYAIKFSDWGFEHIPNISFKHTTESKEAISFIEYNSEGFRGPDEYLLISPENILRIAIVGDSFSEGAEVDFEYLHRTILENSLNEHYNKINGNIDRAEVINAGVYAYDSCQELQLFTHRVKKYKPQIVLLIYTG